MVHGLGTDQRELIRQFHALGMKNGGAERPDGYMLSINDLWSGHSDDSFWISITQKLKDRGMSPERIALVSAVLRKEIAHMNAQKTAELQTLLRQMGIDP